VTIARAKHLPTVSLQGGYSKSNNDFTSNGLKSPQSSNGTNVQAVLNIPIFAGGAIASAARASNAIYQQRATQYQDAMRTAERSAGDAYQAVLTGISSVKAYKAAVTSNRTAVEASQVGQQVGTRTAVDVLNAQQLLYAAESSYAQARYTYLLSVLQLKQTAGRLIEADLAEIDRLLVDNAPIN
jgi:outer membrane protein